LSAPLPRFAHVPMILGPDRARLSKRHGATSVMEYQRRGYLPEALVNYLVRLGWSWKDREIFSRDELVEKFTLDNVGRAAGVFDADKLLWLNAHYLRERSPASLVPLLQPFLEERGYPPRPRSYLERAAETLQPRASTLAEMADTMKFYCVDRLEYDPAAAKKFLKPSVKEPFGAAIAALEGLESFDEKTLEEAFRRTAEDLGVKLGKLAQPVRVAVTGGTISPPIYDTLLILGRHKALARIDRCLAARRGS